MGSKRAADLRVPLGVDVLTAAKDRIRKALDHAERCYVSFSGGKDSTVMLHLVMEACIDRGIRPGVLFVDMEAQYQLTIKHLKECFELYRGHMDPYWVALPLNLRNAVSQYEPFWLCWDPERRDDWVREPDPLSITDEGHFPFFRRGMEFEELVPAFADWFSGGRDTACFVGTRTRESLNRWRGIASDSKQRYNDWSWTTMKGEAVWNVYPIYDWHAEDIWTFHARRPELPHNEVYDRMHQAGLPLKEQRLCQPYGDDQRRGLWLYHALEPETWGKVVARVNGANQGALYAQEDGNILGQRKVTRPEGHTWESFARMLIDTMPEHAAEHYRNKVAVFLKWWSHRGYEQGIPDEANPRMEAARKVPSWRRICKVLLRNDWWCRGLSFSQQKSDKSSYARYMAIMRERRREWGIFDQRAPSFGPPTAKQLALLAALTGGNTPEHARRAMAAALDKSKGWARKRATSDDASEAIDIIKDTDARYREEKFAR